MNLALAFTRIFFLILSIFFITTYMIGISTEHVGLHAIFGVIIGTAFAVFLMGFDVVFRRYNLRSFNIAIVGIFIGYLMGQGLVLILSAILDISQASIVLHTQVIEIIKIGLFLFGIYLGTIFTLRSSDELYVSIPFVKFTPTSHKKKDLLVDASILSDTRIIDIATSGLFDSQIIIPRFLVKELYIASESGSDIDKTKAKRCLESIKKLEEMPGLDIRYNDTDFPETKDPLEKLLRLARLLDANVLTADITRAQTASIEGIKFINLHSLSNALKPLMQAGEKIKIKVQRYGKEPMQGVGYLDDGTMVVVNGGGDFIGETIDAQVLSVKHTTSGRIIFCNANDDHGTVHQYE